MQRRILAIWKRKSPFGSVAEHSLGKGEVPGPIPGMGTSFVNILVNRFVNIGV